MQTMKYVGRKALKESVLRRVSMRAAVCPHRRTESGAVLYDLPQISPGVEVHLGLFGIILPL